MHLPEVGITMNSVSAVCVAQINIAWWPFIGENAQWAESYLEVINKTNSLLDTARSMFPQRKRHRPECGTRNNPSDDEKQLQTTISDAEGQIAYAIREKD